MNADLKNFLLPLAQVIAATLFVVCTVTFLSVPYVLGHLPGDREAVLQASGAQHMT